jgi:hypothetical protein
MILQIYIRYGFIIWLLCVRVLDYYAQIRMRLDALFEGLNEKMSRLHIDVFTKKLVDRRYNDCIVET